MSVYVQNIEYVINELAGSTRLKDILQRLKAGGTVGLESDHLAVEHRLLDWQAGGRLGELRELIGPIASVSAGEPPCLWPRGITCDNRRT